jgi:hypothetical protein
MRLRTHFPDLQLRTLNIETRTRPSGFETGLSIFVLFILGGIGAALFGLQFRHNPANDSLFMHTSESQSPNALQPSQGIRLELPTPGNLVPSGPVEVFSPENLSDKIDGKAELYLSSGVKKLTTQRFRLRDASDAWMEIFQYDMGTPRNGFAVYSGQMRRDGVRLKLTPFSYRTENALFFLDGPTYVEIIGSGSTREEMTAREALARALVGASPRSSETFGELLLFPEPHLDRESISLISTDAFGFERFDNVFTAFYDLGGFRVTAFLSRRESASEAAELASAYHTFLLENGGKALESIPLNGEKAHLVEILDAFELIMTKGPILAGVREAPDQITAESLGRLLMDRLAETQRTRGGPSER